MLTSRHYNASRNWPPWRYTLSHSLLRLLCHDDLYCFCAFSHLNLSVSQLQLDLGVSQYEKLHNCAQTALEISPYNLNYKQQQYRIVPYQSVSGLGDTTCSDSHCQWQRS